MIDSLEKLVEQFSKFPGIGKKTAQRMAFFVLKERKEESEALAQAILDVKNKVGYCSICFNITEGDPCSICRDEKRDRSIICVVEEPQDLLAVERSHAFRGRYHVLQGALSPLNGITPGHLRIAELMKRLGEGKTGEVVLATNFSVEGEATALYLTRLIKPLGIKVSRLAHGIPLGSDLEYVDAATVQRAMEGRNEL